MKRSRGRRIAVAAALAIGLGGADAAFATAQDDGRDRPATRAPSQVTSGSYRSSCIDITWIRNVLSARCKTRGGKILDRTYYDDVTACSDIANADGRLTCVR